MLQRVSDATEQLAIGMAVVVLTSAPHRSTLGGDVEKFVLLLSLWAYGYAVYCHCIHNLMLLIYLRFGLYSCLLG